MTLSSSGSPGIVDQTIPSSVAIDALSGSVQSSLPGSFPDLWTWGSLIAIMGEDVSEGMGNWSSLIGIITAISGNVLIALALNVQRYSHIQLHRKRAEARDRARQALKRSQESSRGGYGSLDGPSYPESNGDGYHDDNHDGAADAEETHPLRQSFQSGQTDDSEDDQVSSSYLKSPSWWLGQVLMTVGEMGNFLAYGFAPASIVSPLGVVALISNCVIAPIFFGEHFRGRDFWGVVIAVLGAVTVVLSAKTEETKLEPHDVWDAITTMEFEIYMGVTISLIILLMWASPRYGNRTILIDLGLVGLFGGYTALTTKGVSSMLSSTLWRAFTTPVTYGLLIVLMGTAVMQVRYVNKALQRFDSTQVIPVQFVTFTLSVIIGSAVLYRDFENATAQQAVKFAGGCALTFFGVFLITSGRHPNDEDEERLSDDDDVEETIGLRRQLSSGSLNALEPQAANPHLHVTSGKSSRRPSLGSRAVSFADDALQPGFSKNSAGTASTRDSESSSVKPALITPDEASALGGNPWQTSGVHSSPRPSLPSVFVSNDSVATFDPVPSPARPSDALQSTKSMPPPSTGQSPIERPTTPPQRLSMSHNRPPSSHYSSKFISPSPLSSTVTAVVGDSLRGENPTLSPRKSNRRLRTRPSIRNSLFVPYHEEEHGESSATVPSETQPLIGSDNGRDTQGSQSSRRRANSLGATLETIFGRKKKRRASTIDTVSSGTHRTHSTEPSCEGQDSRR